jgi:hypothetical protein
MNRTWMAVLSVGALASVSQAQLIVGVDAGVGNVCAWHVDLATNASTALWSGTDVWGLAADDLNGKIYCNAGTPMHVWSYGAGPTTTNLGNPISTVDGAAILFVSLASDPTTAGRLWGGRNSNSATNPEGIYSIDVSVTPPLVTPVFLPGVTSYDWGGLGYDPASGKFYMCSDTAPSGVGAGLFEIDTVAATVTKLAGYPTGQTDIDGCEVIGGKVWLVGDDAGQLLYSWDLALGAYDVATLISPSPFSELFSGGGYAPSLFGASTPTVYCTAGTTTNGCVPAISASNQPSVSAANPCGISIANVEGQKSGLIFYSITGAQAAPWSATSTSFLCVKSPTQRSAPQNSGGTASACDGSLTLDWNAYQAANPGALGNPWSVGAKAYVQGWFRDPPASKTTNLSDAVELTYVP